MPTDATFRLSLYLTLAWACVCIGYAEHDLFPEVPWFAAVAVVVLGVLYWLESRVELLSIPDANRLGLIVGMGYFAWAAFRIVKVLRSEDWGDADIQYVVVALCGPLLITLMPAKLARREKHVGDYWGFHGAALVAAGLSGAMAEDSMCFVLIGLYAATAVWSLTLFHLRRAAGGVAPIPNRVPPPAVADVVSSTQAQSGLWRALGLILAALAIAVPLYFITPRSPAEKLSFGKPRVEIGFAADQMLNLNQTGTLESNPATAFKILATREGQPVRNLPLDIRWRGELRPRYANGRWSPPGPSFRFPRVFLDPKMEDPRFQTQWSPPDLGPEQCQIEFAIPWDLTAAFVAEPLLWAEQQPSPLATYHPSDHSLRAWTWGYNGAFYWNGELPSKEPHRYVQAWQPNADRTLSPKFRVNPGSVRASGELLDNPVPAVKQYADELIKKLIETGKLPPEVWDDRDRIRDLPKRQYHDAIAQAFSEYLATSPEFTYSVNLRRENTDIDPVEEFLLHTRSGHCERFASALTLMLRSQGIPAVLVLGFKGCEPTAEPGRYVVKQEFAHAWVSALIIEGEPAAPGQRELPISWWRSLDPTPTSDPVTITTNDNWAAGARDWFNKRFRDYIADFTPERRRELLINFGQWVQQPQVWGTVVGLALVAFIGMGYRRRSRRTDGVADTAGFTRSEFLNPLLIVLMKHGFVPEVGDTPREFATRVAENLQANSATARVVNVPSAWVDAYYESRFGDRPLAPNHESALHTQLRELQEALSTAPLR